MKSHTYTVIIFIVTSRTLEDDDDTRIRTFIGAVVQGGWPNEDGVHRQCDRVVTERLVSLFLLLSPSLSFPLKIHGAAATGRCMYNVSVYVTGSHDRGHGLIFLPRLALRAGLP